MISTETHALLRAATIRLLAVALLIESLAPLMPFIADEHGLSPSRGLLLLGACQIAMVLAQLLAPPLIHRFGAWRLAALASVLLGGAALLASAVADTVGFCLLLAIMFMANGVGGDAMRIAMRGACPGPAAGHMLALLAHAAEWLQAAIPLAAAVLVMMVGWPGALVTMAAPACVAGLWMLLATGRRDQDAQTQDDIQELDGWRALLARPAFYLPMALAAAYQSCFAPMIFGLPFLLTSAVGMDMSAPAMGAWLAMAHALCLAAQMLGNLVLMRRSSSEAVRRGIWLVALGLLAMLASTWAGPMLLRCGCVLVLLAGGFIMMPSLLESMKVAPEERVAACRVFALVQLAAGGLGLLAAGSGAVLGFLPALMLTTAIALALMAWLRPGDSWAAA